MAGSVEITHLEAYTKRIVLAEGGDEVYLCRRILEDLRVQDTQVGSVKGERRFVEKVPSIVTLPNFRTQIQSVGIVRDAEDDPERSFRDACDALVKADLTPPSSPAHAGLGKPKTRILILPDASNPGMLETLCLQAVAGDARMRCVDSFFECVAAAGFVVLPKKLAKAKAHAFAAASKDPVAGVGAGFLHSKDFWNISSPVWKIVKDFLASL